MKVKSESELLSRVRLLATSWTAAYQAPPSMGFSRQQYWSGAISQGMLRIGGNHQQQRERMDSSRASRRN